MTPSTQLLLDLRSSGFTFRVDGGLLLVSPASKLTEEQRAAIAANRIDLIELLGGQPGPFCPACRCPLDGKSRCWKCGYRRCHGCGINTGSAFIELCVACGLLGMGEAGGKEEVDQGGIRSEPRRSA